ncbi:MAG: hypothetical protein RL536_141 [Candidatus Parcubacteria bacterium]|jgi:hypothetical protein
MAWNKIIYIFILVILSGGFFYLGRYTHQPSPVPTIDGPLFAEATPYLHTVYGDINEPNTCSPSESVPDQYVCIYKLSHSVIDQADALAQKLIEAKQKNPDQFAEFYKDLPAQVRSAQKARDAYFDGICELDSMAIYGGSGMGLEREACRYYYAKQYLNILQKIESKL